MTEKNAPLDALVDADYTKKVQEMLMFAGSRSITELKELASDLRRMDAPNYYRDLIEGHISQKTGDYKNACEKFYQAFAGSANRRILEDFLSCFISCIKNVDEESKADVVAMIINYLQNINRLAFSSENREHHRSAQIDITLLSCYIGKILFNSEHTLPQKEKVAESWLTAIGINTFNFMMCDFTNLIPQPIAIKTSRFLGYLVACLGKKREVTHLHSVLNEKEKQIAEQVSEPGNQLSFGSAEDYAHQPGFQSSPNIFCDHLLTSKYYGEVLDVGCGTGTIGKNLEGRYQAIDGIDINPNYLEYVSKTKIYRELFCGDANEKLKTLDKTYDLITMCMLLDYLPGKDTIKLAEKRLKPKGILAFAFMPSASYSENQSFSATYYEAAFFKKVVPSLTLERCTFKPYMWTGGYYVLLSK